MADARIGKIGEQPFVTPLKDCWWFVILYALDVCKFSAHSTHADTFSNANGPPETKKRNRVKKYVSPRGAFSKPTEKFSEGTHHRS